MENNDKRKINNALTGREDKRDHNIDVNTSIKEMREKEQDLPPKEKEKKEDDQNDAMNYKNDRENGAYNPKNI